jgi:hypothetical protein
MQPISEDINLQFMPVLENKRPIHEKWEQTKKQYDYSNAKAIGLVCGSISGNVEAIDIDLKYDLTGTLFNDYKKAINDIDKTILSKLTVQKTVSNGYHFIYRCETIEGNLKLAQRETILAEKQTTYDKSYDRATKEAIQSIELDTDDKRVAYAKKVAEKEAKADKVRVLIETRGEKGYIACYPTKGYELVYGSFDNIQEITIEQRIVLFNVAYSFNEVVKEYVPTQRIEKKQYKGLTPLEDYNNRGDVVGLLIEHGWKAVGKKGSKILMQRPGDTKADHSGNFDEEKNWFSVFSTSTEFDSQKAYQPYAVFCILECNGDFRELPKKLYDLGYGDRFEKIVSHNNEVPSIIDLSDDDYSFLANPTDYEDYLQKWRTGTFEMGKSTGIPELDKYYLFKEGDLVIINGLDNVGKSSMIWYLATLSNILHNWKWLIFSSENKLGSVVRKLIEFYWCESIQTMSDEKYNLGKNWVTDNFDIIKCGENLFNYKDILNMTTKAMKKKKYNALMIDPYNSLKLDMATNSKQATYDYHYESASYIQLYCKNNNISIYLNCHVGTGAARNKDNSGYTKAPQKEDTEMGVMFANKADQFVTIHRITQHPSEWMFTEIHVRKVKETETGGRVTPYANPISLKMVQGSCGFEYCTTRLFTERGLNPVLNFHNQVKPASAITPNYSFDQSFKEQEDDDDFRPF